MGFLLIAFRGVQIPELSIGWRQRNGGVQIPGLMLHEALFGWAIIIATIEVVCAHADPEFARDDRPHQESVGLISVAVFTFFLQEVIILQHPGPFFEVPGLFGDDVDHATNRVRAIQRGHGAANDLHPFNGSQRRHKSHFATNVMPVGTGFAGRLLDTVDHKRGIGRIHTAHLYIAGGQTAVTVAHQHARHLAQRFRDILIGTGIQRLLIKHRDRRRRLAPLLAETCGGDYHLLFVYGGAICSVGSRGQIDEGERNRHLHVCLNRHKKVLRI